jgi:CheY-like chemotaxis protein/two-component sensor histidine kinase
VKKDFRILIVDDEFAPRESMRMILRPLYVVNVASDGDEAFRLLEHEPYDLMITDLKMPGVSGIDLLSKARKSWPAMQCGVVTGYGTGVNALDAFRLGAVFFIAKPFNVADIITEVSRAEKRKRLYEWAATGEQLLRNIVGDKKFKTEVDTILNKILSNEKSDRTQHVKLERPANREIYPFVVGGLLHDSLNTIWALKENVNLFSLRHEDNSNHEVLGLIRRLAIHIDHLEAVLRLIQSMSREYYRPEPSEPLQQSGRVEKIIMGFASLHREISYEYKLDPLLDDTQLPLGIIAFITGELLENATRASLQQGSAKVTFEILFHMGERTISIECRDTGPGFSKEILEKIQKGEVHPPRESGKKGYGLYLMKQIVDRLQGSILASNFQPSGARIQVLLPLEKIPWSV